MGAAHSHWEQSSGGCGVQFGVCGLDCVFDPGAAFANQKSKWGVSAAPSDGCAGCDFNAFDCSWFFISLVWHHERGALGGRCIGSRNVIEPSSSFGDCNVVDFWRSLTDENALWLAWQKDIFGRVCRVCVCAECSSGLHRPICGGNGMKHEVFIVGLSHHTAPLSLREKLAVPSSKVHEVLGDFASKEPFEEAMVLSTCNRVELYGTSKRVEQAIMVAKQFFLDHEDVHAQEIAPLLYERAGEEAVLHAFRVASSLDSMVIGEPQILGQMKEAYELAKKQRTLGSLLDKCMMQSFAVAKQVRSQTKIGEGAVNVSSVACDLAAKVFGEMKGRTVLVIGAGEMAEAAAAHLKSMGASIHIVNRSLERAEVLAKKSGGRALPYEQLASELCHADIVITSTSSDKPIITPSLMKDVSKARRHRPLFMMDVSVPRNVDPRVGELDSVFLYDVDDLQQVTRENLEARQNSQEEAEKMIAKHLVEFNLWRDSLLVKPTIVSLRKQVETLIDNEMERTISKMKHLSDADVEHLRSLGKSLGNKLLHAPTTKLKQRASDLDAMNLVDAVHQLFELKIQDDSEINTPETASSNVEGIQDLVQPHMQRKPS